MEGLRKIETLVEIKAGYQHRPADELTEAGSFLLIQQKDIFPDRTRIHYAHAARISPKRKHTRQILKDGDVLFINKGHAPFACVVRDLPQPAIASSAFFILTSESSSLFPEYLAWSLNRKQVKRELFRAAGRGSKMPVIHRQVLEQQLIPLPALETQKIVTKLHHLAIMEKEIMHQLTEEKTQLIRAVCEKLILKTKPV